ncbi:gamma-glutamyl-gamma-aminobutyrate hydrolase family protein [Microbacteriaceae bacterium VKM Ac-2855]|nr:gamma-glutamyl-gamma-aminobutyrate hydrolase family protein [Microbacteriaceae bacterium VKM Ac-2855]
MTRRALAIVNERGAGLGALEAILVRHGFEVESVSGTHLDTVDIEEPDLVIALGASAGVYETVRHPFISPEIALLQDRIHHRLPTIGICFGAQLIAAALGEVVHPGPSREVGFRHVVLTEAGHGSALRHVADTPMMQWHGDTFDLPDGATLLASSPEYAVEAFAIGDWLLGVQFHPELTPEMTADWLAGDADYAAEAGYTAGQLAEDRLAGHFERMRAATESWLTEWITARA